MSDDKIDLEELRKKDKLKPKKILTDEDKKIILDQKETGKIMDDMFKKEMFLRKDPEFFKNDDSLLLYRLPLNKKQMKAIHKNIMKDHNKNK